MRGVGGPAGEVHRLIRRPALDRGDDLPVVGVRQLTRPGEEVERWVVTLAGPDGEIVADVESRPSDEAAHLTCHATHPAHSRSWHVTLER